MLHLASMLSAFYVFARLTGLAAKMSRSHDLGDCTVESNFRSICMNSYSHQRCKADNMLCRFVECGHVCMYVCKGYCRNIFNVQQFMFKHAHMETRAQLARVDMWTNEVMSQYHPRIWFKIIQSLFSNFGWGGDTGPLTIYFCRVPNPFQRTLSAASGMTPAGPFVQPDIMHEDYVEITVGGTILKVGLAGAMCLLGASAMAEAKDVIAAKLTEYVGQHQNDTAITIADMDADIEEQRDTLNDIQDNDIDGTPTEPI